MSEQAQLDVGAAVTRFTTAVGERVLAARSASGLSSTQLQVLRLAADGVTMSELVRILGTPKSTMTSVVDQLEALGLAERTADADDRRRQVVVSTSSGSEQLGAFDAALESRVDEMLAGLSPVRAERLTTLMARLPSATVPLPLSGPS